MFYFGEQRLLYKDDNDDDDDDDDDDYYYSQMVLVNCRHQGQLCFFCVFLDAWSCVQPMNEGRQFAAAVSSNDKIFIFGGCDGHNVLRSCEVYNTKHNRWQHISPMRCSRMKHSAVVHAGKIYVIGGVRSNRTGPLPSSVECYIPEENRWTSVPDMPGGRFDHQCYVAKVGYKFVASVMEKPK